MPCPTRTRCLLAILFFCLVFIGYFFLAMHQLPPPTKYKLKDESKLDAINSRGATIFIDADDVIRIPPNYILDLMELRDLEELFDRYLGSIQIICKRKVHLGDVTDAGYDVCEDIKVRPLPPCLAYSFGVRGDYLFEETISSMYKCEVHVFTPSKPSETSTSLHLHEFHVNAGEDKLPTIDELKEELNHQKKSLSIMKLDITGDEWTFLAQMLTGTVLQDVDQLLVTFHSLLDQSSRSVDHRNKLDYRQHLSLLRGLYDLGFRTFYHRRVAGEECVYTDDFHITRTGCHEISMMKMK